MLEKLHKYEKLWLKYITECGCNIDTAKDILQEFYIKMMNKEDYSYDEDSPNFYGCYVVLRNMVFDLKRKEKKIQFVELDYLIEAEDEGYIEDDFDLKVKAISKWLEHNSIDFTKEYIEYNRDILTKVWYKEIYQAIFESGISMLQFSKDTGIRYDTVRVTVKNIKEQIKNQ